MKTSTIAAFCATCLLVAPAAFAQTGIGRGNVPAGPTAGQPVIPGFGRSATVGKAQPGVLKNSAAAVSDKTDSKVFPAEATLPAPVPPDQIKPGTLVLPNDPVEPFLLTRQNGPFMVMAKTFRGPDAERYAVALVKELRNDYGLPAYILRLRDFPLRSNIRNVPPTAPSFFQKSQISEPEKTRTHDEAAVLIGNEKTLDASEALLKQVKKIRPKCLNQIPGIFEWRVGLSAATRTTNPYVPAQDIYPGMRKKDHLIAQMNSGPRSVYHCPARYTLQVAEFSGRTMYNPQKNDNRLWDDNWLSKSPLRTAADDAEKLAEALAKDPEVQRTGAQPYVYHDRTSSKVMIGAFASPSDPHASELHNQLLRIAVPLSSRKRAGMMIAPANNLTDLEDPNRPIKSNN